MPRATPFIKVSIIWYHVGKTVKVCLAGDNYNGGRQVSTNARGRKGADTVVKDSTDSAGEAELMQGLSPPLNAAVSDML